MKNPHVYENFTHENGWKYKNAEELAEAYNRLCKYMDGILITQDEFLAEAAAICYSFDAEKAKDVYNALVRFVQEYKLSPSAVYEYARYKWCLNSSSAIVAYQIRHTFWEVNNCGDEISEERARIIVNGEFLFEASRVNIIGTPYYCSTDYNFIRFDCGALAWLMKNGHLYSIYNK